MARTRARDFEKKQHNLLLDAARVFATQGMEKASMSQIATEAGVSKSLLYHYYPSKDALIFEIIHSHLEQMNADLETADDPALPPRDRLEQLVLTVLMAYKGADNQHKVQLNAGPVLTDEQKERIREQERKLVVPFARALKELRPELANPERPLLTPVTMSLFGMMNWVYLWFHEDGALSRADYAQLATDMVLGGISELK